MNEQLVDAIVGSYCCMCGGRGPYPLRLISPFEPDLCSFCGHNMKCGTCGLVRDRVPIENTHRPDYAGMLARSLRGELPK